jgi:hypothetical protein
MAEGSDFVRKHQEGLVSWLRSQDFNFVLHINPQLVGLDRLAGYQLGELTARRLQSCCYGPRAVARDPNTNRGYRFPDHPRGLFVLFVEHDADRRTHFHGFAKVLNSRAKRRLSERGKAAASSAIKQFIADGHCPKQPRKDDGRRRTQPTMLLDPFLSSEAWKERMNAVTDKIVCPISYAMKDWFYGDNPNEWIVEGYMGDREQNERF